jgi:hypothetical protein
MASALSQFMQAQNTARARNQSRLNQATALYDSIIAQFSGGDKSPLMASVNKQLDIGGRKAVSQGMQSLVNAGLSGTTAAAGLGTRYEEEVGAPTRLNALDTIAQRLANAQMAKAGLLERVEDTVDTSQFGNLMMAANSGGGGQSYGFGADAQQISAASYLQPKTSGSNVTYGSPNNMGKYQPATVAIRNGAATKNLNTAFLDDYNQRKAANPISNITYGSAKNMGGAYKSGSMASQPYANLTPTLQQLGW